MSSEEICDDPPKALRGLAVPVVGASSGMILQNTLSIFEGFLIELWLLLANDDMHYAFLLNFL